MVSLFRGTRLVKGPGRLFKSTRDSQRLRVSEETFVWGSPVIRAVA